MPDRKLNIQCPSCKEPVDPQGPNRKMVVNRLYHKFCPKNVVAERQQSRNAMGQEFKNG